MITSDDVFDRLSEANPHPDISDLVPTSSQLTAFLRQLEGEPVETITRPPEPDQKPVRGGLLVAAGAFALVLIVIGAAWLLNDDQATEAPADTTVATTAPPTTAAPPAEEPAVSAASQVVLDSFAATYNTGDLDGHLALFAPGATIALGDNGGRPSPNGAQSGTDFNRTLEQHGERIAHEARLNTQMELSDCSGDELVRCTATYRDFISDALMGGDLTTVTLEIVDGEIRTLTETAVNGRAYDDWLWEMGKWVESNHGVSLDWTNPSFDPSSAAKWHVFGRLYLDFARRPYAPVPFAPDVELEDLAAAVKFGDALGTTEDAWMAMWHQPTYRYVSDQEYTMDEETVRTIATWAILMDGTETLKACEPISDGERVLCTYAAEDAFSRAIGMDPWDSLWSFAVVNGRIADVQLFDGGRLAYAAQVDAFTDWAAENHPEVGVSAGFGEFVYTQENAEAVLSLLDEYSTYLGN